MLSGCHHSRHDNELRAIKAMYPPVSIDTNTNTGQVHSVQYTKVGKALEQTLDLYLPLNAKPPYPVIIWIHGGSWMYGDKSDNCLPCQSFSSKYAIASLNYRLDTESQFPTQMWDVKAAVRYLRAHAALYKLDPDRFAVWGSSAGGHLAALLGTSGDVKELEGNEGYREQSSRVQSVIDWCGPTDFLSAQAQAPSYCKIKFTGPSSPVFVLMGGRMDKNSLKFASPVTYASKDDPPFLIMHGDKDDAIPPLQSEELYRVLKSKGVDATYQLLPGYGHAFSAPEHLKTVEEFLERTLREQKPAR
jgi:acetyl esterase/lipase